jgi:plasmid stabilization system protein ParE
MRARRLIVTPRAKRDIARIIAWYKEHLGARAAAKASRTIKASLLATRTITAEAASRPDLPRGFYRVVARVHLVIFQIEGDTARVIRVVHGARDVPAAMEEM